MTEQQLEIAIAKTKEKMAEASSTDEWSNLEGWLSRLYTKLENMVMEENKWQWEQ